MDAVTWITLVTQLAGMSKAWLEARKAGLEFDAAKKKVRSARTKPRRKISASESDFAEGLVIRKSTLKVLIKDIEQAERRYEACFDDPRYTPADIDSETRRAKLTICTHLQRIRDFNEGRLPAGDLERSWKMWDCPRALRGSGAR
jgi:hypothetical protein